MRTLILVLMLLVPGLGVACTIVEVLDPACQRDPDACVRRDLAEMYERADVVYEFTVQSSSKRSLWRRDRYVHRVSVGHTWKTDGRALDVVQAGSGGGDCTVSLSAGETYLVFANRLKSKWSFLPWIDEPLYAGIARTFQPSEFAAMSAYHIALYNAKSEQSLREALAVIKR